MGRFDAACNCVTAKSCPTMSAHGSTVGAAMASPYPRQPLANPVHRHTVSCAHALDFASRGREKASSPEFRSAETARSPGPPVVRESAKRSWRGVTLTSNHSHRPSERKRFGGRCPFAAFTPKRSNHNPLVRWLPNHLADRRSDRPESLTSRRTADPRPPTTFLCGSLAGDPPSAEAFGLLPFTFRLDRCGRGTFEQHASHVKSYARDPQGYPRTFFVVPTSTRSSTD